MVQGTEYMRRRLGRHITRKGNKYGLWVDEEEADGDGSESNPDGNKKKCTTIVAHYRVEGERGSAKVSFFSPLSDFLPLVLRFTSSSASFSFSCHLINIYTVQIVMQVEQSEAHPERKLVLLLAEFSTRDKFVLFELDDKPQLPAM